MANEETNSTERVTLNCECGHHIDMHSKGKIGCESEDCSCLLSVSGVLAARVAEAKAGVFARLERPHKKITVQQYGGIVADYIDICGQCSVSDEDAPETFRITTYWPCQTLKDIRSIRDAAASERREQEGVGVVLNENENQLAEKLSDAGPELEDAVQWVREIIAARVAEAVLDRNHWKMKTFLAEEEAGALQYTLARVEALADKWERENRDTILGAHVCIADLRRSIRDDK